MKTQVRYIGLIIVSIMLLFGLTACHKKDEAALGKIKVITTLLPLYDFARNVGGEHVVVSLLVPPGVEPHHFEPKPGDMAKINSADLFIYTGKNMEPWVEVLLRSTYNTNLVVVDASKGITLLESTEKGEESHDSHEKGREGHGGPDPHVWLDFGNAAKMVDNITDGLITRDPAHKDYYMANAQKYKAALADLDQRFKMGLDTCRVRTFVHGGHFAFNYLAKRYGLAYVSAYQGSPNAEPTPRRIMALKKLMKEKGITAVYYEELITPRMAEVLASETGAELLPLHGAHNISRDDMEKGITFMALMDKNLQNLRKGLGCK
ncbi:MAG TPA: zinc ABC transporter substrate-binding protein [Syntrophorhabdaceae bacterium]